MKCHARAVGLESDADSPVRESGSQGGVLVLAWMLVHSVGIAGIVLRVLPVRESGSQGVRESVSQGVRAGIVLRLRYALLCHCGYFQ